MAKSMVLVEITRVRQHLAKKIDLWHEVNLRRKLQLECKVELLPPQGFRPEGEIPSRHSSNSPVLRKVPTVITYSQYMPEKISICLNRGREESVGNDDVSIVRARKYEMVRIT